MDPQITRRTALAGGVAALATSSLAAAPATAASSPHATRTIDVLAFNIWFGGTAVPGGLEMVQDVIVGTGSDVVLLSEAGDATTELAARLTAAGHTFHGVPSGDTGVLSRYPVIESAVLPWMTKAVLGVGRHQVAVYAAHLEYRWYATYLPRAYGPGVPAPGRFSEYGWDKIPTGPVTDLAAIQQCNEDSGRPAVIEDFLEDAARERAKGRLVILGGDFNEPSLRDWTTATKDMYDHEGLVIPWASTAALEEAGYVDAYRAAFPDPVTHSGATWPASNDDASVGQLTWAPEADERDRIDYVFASPMPGLRLRRAGIVGPRATIVRSERVDEPRGDDFIATPDRWPSDHKAVLASYQLVGPPIR